MKPTVVIECTVPVLVYVDLETGEIDRVVVVDEEVRAPDLHDPVAMVAATSYDGSNVPVTPEHLAAAYSLADGPNEAEWPSWTFDGRGRVR